MNDPRKFWAPPALKDPSLVVAWSLDASKFGAGVADYLTRRLDGKIFCEIEPVEFFPVGGVAVENSLVQFPESQFFACPEKNLVVFLSSQPHFQWYKFLSLILDTAQQFGTVKELYIIGSMVSPGAHTAPREIMSIFSTAEMKEALSDYNLAGGLDFETPPGQRPALNSFLLWAAQQRSIPAVCLWVPIPFYLVTSGDPAAERGVLELLNQRLALDMDLSDLDEEIGWQKQVMADMRHVFPRIDESIRRLESKMRLSDEEGQRLLKETEKFLREKSR